MGSPPVVVVRRRKQGLTAQRLDLVRGMHAAGRTVPQIGMALHLRQCDVERALEMLRLKPHPIPPRANAYEHTERPAKPERPNPLNVAREWLVTSYRMRKLPPRLTEGTDGFALDGVPCTLDDVIRETNRLLKESGMEQLVGSPAWVVR